MGNDLSRSSESEQDNAQRRSTGEMMAEQLFYNPFDDIDARLHFPEFADAIAPTARVSSDSEPSINTLATMYPVDFPQRFPQHERSDVAAGVQHRLNRWFVQQTLRKAMEGDSPTPSCDWTIEGLPFKDDVFSKVPEDVEHNLPAEPSSNTAAAAAACTTDKYHGGGFKHSSHSHSPEQESKQNQLAEQCQEDPGFIENDNMEICSDPADEDIIQMSNSSLSLPGLEEDEETAQGMSIDRKLDLDQIQEMNPHYVSSKKYQIREDVPPEAVPCAPESETGHERSQEQIEDMKRIIATDPSGDTLDNLEEKSSYLVDSMHSTTELRWQTEPDYNINSSGAWEDELEPSLPTIVQRTSNVQRSHTSTTVPAAPHLSTHTVHAQISIQSRASMVGLASDTHSPELLPPSVERCCVVSSSEANQKVVQPLTGNVRSKEVDQSSLLGYQQLVVMVASHVSNVPSAAAAAPGLGDPGLDLDAKGYTIYEGDKEQSCETHQAHEAPIKLAGLLLNLQQLAQPVCDPDQSIELKGQKQLGLGLTSSTLVLGPLVDVTNTSWDAGHQQSRIEGSTAKAGPGKETGSETQKQPSFKMKQQTHYCDLGGLDGFLRSSINSTASLHSSTEDNSKENSHQKANVALQAASLPHQKANVALQAASLPSESNKGSPYPSGGVAIGKVPPSPKKHHSPSLLHPASMQPPLPLYQPVHTLPLPQNLLLPASSTSTQLTGHPNHYPHYPHTSPDRFPALSVLQPAGGSTMLLVPNGGLSIQLDATAMHDMMQQCAQLAADTAVAALVHAEGASGFGHAKEVGGIEADQKAGPSTLSVRSVGVQTLSPPKDQQVQTVLTGEEMDLRYHNEDASCAEGSAPYGGSIKDRAHPLTPSKSHPAPRIAYLSSAGMNTAWQSTVASGLQLPLPWQSTMASGLQLPLPWQSTMASGLQLPLPGVKEEELFKWGLIIPEATDDLGSTTHTARDTASNSFLAPSNAYYTQEGLSSPPGGAERPPSTVSYTPAAMSQPPSNHSTIDPSTYRELSTLHETMHASTSLGPDHFKPQSLVTMHDSTSLGPIDHFKPQSLVTMHDSTSLGPIDHFKPQSLVRRNFLPLLQNSLNEDEGLPSHDLKLLPSLKRQRLLAPSQQLQNSLPSLSSSKGMIKTPVSAPLHLYNDSFRNTAKEQALSESGGSSVLLTFAPPSLVKRHFEDNAYMPNRSLLVKRSSELYNISTDHDTRQGTKEQSFKAVKSVSLIPDSSASSWLGHASALPQHLLPPSLQKR
ncbi:hypothetical protein CEUSTIGMA_g11995.t1 [Chlamydomonas eustigma]|uniref:Uncharacterized protein n=1 Tax=Chlamydomonas eustigma TaxID=1157962 RepID=A0A250XNB2_9CHLO|nr:hypothetical protein CEUSTIGMA_g11995.t1 [Chlamydomonas eustigma]|eukprot:GAX84574.1 hypothetical protein CEUSTIGMA_g11995.t1 [Chlamydomonas eustigma]